MLNMLDNAPTVAVNCKDCDGYEVGYSTGLKDAERPQDDIFPMKIVAGKYAGCGNVYCEAISCKDCNSRIVNKLDVDSAPTIIPAD